MGSLLLEDINKLAWNEYGAPDGEPVFYFHGTPGSRLEACSADAIARDLDIRLIAPERPGYGNSDPQNDFGLLTWPNAVTQLADKLNLQHFSILGYSGGGPYALACAYQIPDRINQITLVGSLAPFESDAMQNHINADFKPLYELAASDYPSAIQQASKLIASPEAFLDILCTQLPAADMAIVERDNFRVSYLKNLEQASIKGVDGVVTDLHNLALPWQFDIHTITKKIDIWHGRDDKNVGFSIGKYLVDALPDTSPHYLDNAGHYFLFEQWKSILQCFKEVE